MIAMLMAAATAFLVTILVTPLGRGTYVYSTITFFQQLPGGVPGSLRLLVNLVSAGCRPSGSGPAKC